MNFASIQRFGRAVVSYWRDAISRRGLGGAVLFPSVIVTALACASFIAFGENPWDLGVVAKISSAEKLTIGETIGAGLWLGSVVNLTLAVLLIVTARWWARPLHEPPNPIRQFSQTSAGVDLGRRWFWGLVLLAVIVAASARAPRLNHSFWNDEEQAFRKFTWGEYRPADSAPGSESAVDAKDLKFVPTHWDRGLFYSINGNNHVYHTIWARLCHGAWRTITRPDPETFREPIIRLEPFVSGLLAIVALAGWLRVAGFPLAGVTSAWLLALHPWVLRYAVEARGYAALLLFVALTFLCLTLALQTRRWRWWLGYGLCQFLYLLCFAGAVYLAVGINVIALGLLFSRGDLPGIWRWLVSCLLGAMAFLQIMTATMLRIWMWLQAPTVASLPMDRSFFQDFWAHLATGEPWSGPDPSLHFGIDAMILAAESPVWGACFKFVLPALVVLGLIIACARCKAASILFGALVIDAGLILLAGSRSEMPFYSWYAHYFVIGFVVAIAFIPEGGALIMKRWKRGKFRAELVISTGIAALTIGFVSWLEYPSFARIREHDRHPMRQAVVLVRGESPAIAPSHARLLTGAIGSGANQLRTYDPRVHRIQTEPELDALLDKARSTKRPLVLYVCGQMQLERTHPELFSRLANRAEFEVGPYLPGLEEFWSFQILRLRASAVE